MIHVFRIANCKYIDDLSGKGAALHGGRWNSIDVYMLYAAESPALALLEAIAHIGKIPEQRYCMITIEMPNDKIETIAPEQLSTGWHKSPPPDFLKVTGDNFIRANISLALKVPSVLMPEEHNFLINPNHKDFKKIKTVANRPLNIDERLLS